MLDPSILGLWTDQDAFCEGIYPDEENQSGKPIHRTPPAQAPLEVFHQIGLLYSRSSSSVTPHTDLDDEDGWNTSNYVLIVNGYDNSIWVLWRKFVFYPESADYGLAKDIWLGEYAVFPGLEGTWESVIFARLADNWQSLEPEGYASLRLTHIRRAPSARDQGEEHPISSARRIAQGAIRRENDFRSMDTRHI